MRYPYPPRAAKLTPFQWRVLKAVAEIPLGETRTYAWVARAAGHPGAARAVGGALKRNPYPLIIPCHRVVRGGGQLGGYSGGGPEVKARLLSLEREIAKNISQAR